ncbi:MAG: hypothetical protein C4542_02180 [Dehalococcoidia bacterium]|nr:MAG: hypothetical protein C4542_02180 [Dehalococcoidia bacterium]
MICLEKIDYKNFNLIAAKMFLIAILIAALFYGEERAEGAPPPAVIETAVDKSDAGKEETRLPQKIQPNNGGQSQKGSSATNGNFGIKPVSPGEFVGKVENIISGANVALGSIIVQLAIFGMLVSLAVLAVGGLFGIGLVKRVGFGGLLMSAFGLLVYFLIPVILGLIKSFAGQFEN